MHLALHVLVPAVLAFTVWRQQPWRTLAWLMAGMVIDLDHLLADPVYDPQRCSIGFHPLHTWPAALLYAGLLAFRPTRLFGIGLWIHLLLDAGDCVGMPGGLDQLLRQMRNPWIP